MGKYTVYNSEKIDDTIDGYLKIIVEEVKSSVDANNLVSIILIGGFARGEGSITPDKEKVHLMNDFDIFIITKSPLSIDLKQLSLQCLQKCGIKSNFSFEKSTGVMQFYIDFRNMTLEELGQVAPFIKYYEIRNSARVIYGENVLNLIPNYNLSDIPLEEGLRHMFNRLSLLAEYLAPSYSSKNPEEQRTALFFIGKCYLSIAEALLLYSGDFLCSYRKRAQVFSAVYRKKFPQLWEKIPDLDKKVHFHTLLKLKPLEKNFDITKLWFEARDDTLRVIEFYINQIYNKKISSENRIVFSKSVEKILRKNLFQKYLFWYLKLRKIPLIKFTKILNLPAQWYFNYIFLKEMSRLTGKSNLRLLFSFTDPGIKLYSSAILCLSSIDNNLEINKSTYLAASRKLRQLIPFPHNREANFSSWKDLCSLHTQAFRVFQFLKV